MDALAEQVPDREPPYATVVFDCDSTLSSIEGIDELAGPDLLGELAEMTARAMEGELPLEAVYGARLERVQPSREALERLGARYVATLLPGVRELVRDLLSLDKRVLIFSGGLLPAVRALGVELGLEPVDVFAVDVYHEHDGRYRDFDRASPLARAGGKLELLRRLGGARGLGPIALVGDGATDREALPELARFVAFGGVARRPAVHADCPARTDEAHFDALRPFLFSDAEHQRLSER
jgi:phosphoserine phosphatase